jgi:hypothetical protein
VASKPLDDRVRLWAVPPADFTRERDALARELKAQGRAEDAKAVARLRKPPVALWIVNQLARLAGAEVQALIDATARAHRAQSGGGAADDLREAMRLQRESLQRLTDAAGRAAGEAKAKFDLALQRRVQNTVQAAAASMPEQLRDGALEEELEPSGFEELLAGARLAPAPVPPRAASVTPIDPAARAKEAERQRLAHAVAEAEAEEKRLAGRADKLAEAADRAEQDAARARNAAEEARQEAREAAARALELRRK